MHTLAHTLFTVEHLLQCQTSRLQQEILNCFHYHLLKAQECSLQICLEAFLAVLAFQEVLLPWWASELTKADPGGASIDCGPDASPFPERAVLVRRAHVPGPLLYGSPKLGWGTRHMSLNSELVLLVGEIQEKSICNKLQTDKIIKICC